jgi:hypothetical protein
MFCCWRRFSKGIGVPGKIALIINRYRQVGKTRLAEALGLVSFTTKICSSPVVIHAAI